MSKSVNGSCLLTKVTECVLTPHLHILSEGTLLSLSRSSPGDGKRLILFASMFTLGLYAQNQHRQTIEQTSVSPQI